ncbi:CBM35 domain-containing protein [Streptomyces sp. NPDC091266]|uniref:CBM35 domain-containing protein n=1 Tax=Streptomyces sp. NPDC091266 TaxID=3365978 RepID=UPI00382BEA8C
MTAGNNGADTPENDDPFAYLYRSEGGEGGAVGQSGDGGAARQPGVPRTSYNQVRAVGQRQYGGQQSQQVTYGQQNAHYAAPETLPGGDRPRQAQGGQAHGGGQEPRRHRNGLLIGAVSVVAVVCIGIGVAMLTNGKDDAEDTAGNAGPTAGESVKPSDKPSSSDAPVDLPQQDAATLKLSPEAITDKAVAGAKASSGAYVVLNKVGASVNWNVDVPKSGDYTLFIDYGVPGKDAKTTLSVNGDPASQKINMSNFAHAEEGAWDKGWTYTYRWIHLNKGTNTVAVSCAEGDQCEANLDQLSLTAGHVKKK